MNKPAFSLSTLPVYAYHHPIIIFMVFSLLIGGAVILAKKLSMDADLGALLPDSFASVQDLEKVKNRFGGIGYVVVTVRGDNPDAMRKLADTIAEKTKNLEHISFVDYRRPIEFFKDRSLYYLSTDELKTIQKRIKKRWKWEKRKRNPMYVDLEEGDPPSLSFDDIKENYETENSSSWMNAQQSPEAYYFNEEKTFLAVFVKPNITSANLGLSESVVHSVSRAVDEIDLSDYDDTLSLAITGRYKKKIDLQEEMKKDMGIASAISLGLVIFYLFLHFRRLEAIVLIAVPLVTGICFTFAFAAVVFTQLNILTAFIGVILLGLGIDHGIHLLSRYKNEMRKGESQTQTIINTFINTGRSVAVAAITTFVIFLGLGISEFKAFYEFGIIAAAGIIFIMLAYLLLMPSLLRIVNRSTWKFESAAETTGKSNPLANLHKKHAFKFLALSAILAIASVIAVNHLTFNYDFESLGNSELASFKLDKEVNQLLGYSQTPMVALTNNLQEEYYVSDALRTNQETLKGDSGIDFLLSSSDLIPVEQAEKAKVLKKILKTVKRVKKSWLEDDELEKLNELKEILKTPPFEYADLPLEIRQLFGNQTNKTDEEGAIMLFPSVSLSDGDKVINLAAEVRGITQQSGERLVVAGESMILADILNLIFEESPKILLLSLVLIFAVLWVFLKNWKQALIALVPAVFTLLLTLAIMSLLKLELNYINMIMIPILIGIGVDSGVHMVNRALDGHSLNSIIDETGLAIFGSIFTSGIGLGALLLTNHPGLNSLAIVAIIGLSINLLISLLVLPSLIEKFTINSDKIDRKVTT